MSLSNSILTQQSDGIQGRQPLEAQQFFSSNMESEEMPLTAIQTLISLYASIQQYLSKVMGSRGSSPWKLSKFFKLVSEEHSRHLSAFMPLSSILLKYQCDGARGSDFFYNLDAEEMPCLDTYQPSCHIPVS